MVSFDSQTQVTHRSLQVLLVKVKKIIYNVYFFLVVFSAILNRRTMLFIL